MIRWLLTRSSISLAKSMGGRIWTTSTSAINKNHENMSVEDTSNNLLGDFIKNEKEEVTNFKVTNTIRKNEEMVTTKRITRLR